MRIMQIVGRTNGQVINRRPFPFYFITIPVKPFEFCKKLSPRKIIIQYTHRIMRIQCSQQVITRLPDRPHVTGSDVTGGAYKKKILQGEEFNKFRRLSFSRLAEDLLSMF